MSLAGLQGNTYNEAGRQEAIMDIAEFEALMLPVLIGGLVLFMAGIVFDLGRKSRAGKWGMFVLFATLGLGVLGFLLKTFAIEFIL